MEGLLVAITGLIIALTALLKVIRNMRAENRVIKGANVVLATGLREAKTKLDHEDSLAVEASMEVAAKGNNDIIIQLAQAHEDGVL